MDSKKLVSTLESLLEDWENEVVEFKEDNETNSKIGKYFSALSNEANLRGRSCGWLVFGVRNKDRAVCGTDYRCDRVHLQSLSNEIRDGLEPNTTFRNIYEVCYENKRILMLEIPSAPVGVPVSWNGHYYGRAGETLCALGVDKLDEIRSQAFDRDWSAEFVPDADLSDLCPIACEKARLAFAKKHQSSFVEQEVRAWDLSVFLDRAKVTRSGKITRTAVLLVGKPESAHLLNPHPSQITWKLEGVEKAYEHFGPPFILTTTELFGLIRNIKIKLLPDFQLIHHEISKYEQLVVMEAMHNCIAHQDYGLNERVLVTEFTSKLQFENAGSFYDGNWTDYVEGGRTPRRYRNAFLAQAMAELNMIDTMGYGIHRMFAEQRKRYMPLPDFISSDRQVTLTVHGEVVDPEYTKILMRDDSLEFQDVLALDRIQKRLPVDADAVRRLRRAKLVEGRKPNLFVSASVAGAMSQKGGYIKSRAFDNRHYEDMVVEFLRKFGTASRKDIDDLLWDKLSDLLTEKQKNRKIGNIISKLRISGRILNSGPKAKPRWQLVD